MLLSVLAAVVLVGVLSALVLIPPALDLIQARSELERPAEELTFDALQEVHQRLQSAAGHLDGTAASLVKRVPVVGANAETLDQVAVATRDSLEAALTLRRSLEEADDAGVFGDGRVQLDNIADLKAPLGRQASALDRLADTARRQKGGLLLPPLWTALEGLQWRADTLAGSGRRVLQVLDLLPGLVGQGRPRRYLILLINNAELRGAGGVLVGVGTLQVDDGRLELGRFSSIHRLRPARFTRVPAPPEYERRFSIYDANSTLWLNSTYSPDVPDVALVASRIYRVVTGQRTDGAIVADPRGLQSLLEQEQVLGVPGSDRQIRSDELARFVYSDAYEEFDTQRERRDAILGLGRAAINRIVETGFGNAETREAIGAALAGGHLRFVSFDDEEQAALDSVGVTGELGEPVDDDVMVTVQNMGGGGSQGSKLDYWTERNIGHTCVIDDDLSARCAVEVTLVNAVPDGLTTYVGGRPYGLLRSYVEVYLPRDATITSATRDGGAVDFRPDEQSGYHALGVSVELAQDQITRVRFDYELPARSAPFTVRIRPQPLARDAGVSVELRLPRDGIWHGAGEVDDRTVRWRGTLEGPVGGSLTADTRSGLPSFWDALGDFLREPVF